MSIAEHLGRSLEKHHSKHKKIEKKHKIRRMEIEPADEGPGFAITHYLKEDRDAGPTKSGAIMGGGYKEPVKHVAGNHKELLKHIKEHLAPDAADVEEEGVEK